MAKVRQDAWSHEDDLLLAETVLRHVREGSTQLKAFEEVGDKLNRTSAACGFRWNAEVRKRYTQAMELAKRQRKEKKRALAQEKKPQVTTNKPLTTVAGNSEQTFDQSSLTLDGIIQYLKNFKQTFELKQKTTMTLEEMTKENEVLQEEVDELTKQLTKTEKQLATIQEDYQTFIQIMDRARKMTVLEDQGALKSPAFRMDKNGNLEQLSERMN